MESTYNQPIAHRVRGVKISENNNAANALFSIWRYMNASSAEWHGNVTGGLSTTINSNAFSATKYNLIKITNTITKGLLFWINNVS